MASTFKTNIPKYNAVVEDTSDDKKNKKKKSFVTLFSHKIQKKITKNLNIFPENNSTISESLTGISEENEPNDKKLSGNKKNVCEVTKVKSLKINNVNETKPPVPPRLSSNIPTRGSSSNYDVNYYNSILFDKYPLSQTSKDDSVDYKSSKYSKHQSLNLKRSNSELTPFSSNENLSSIYKDRIIQNSKSTENLLKFNQDQYDHSLLTLVQDSNITLTLTDETLSEIDKKINRSDSSGSESSSYGSSSTSNGNTSNSDSSSPSSPSSPSSSSFSYSEKDKSMNDSKNSEKFYFDEKRGNTIKKQKSETSEKMDKILRRESEKYMDQQLVDLCSTYYKDYYYGKHSNSSLESDSSDGKSSNISDEKDKEISPKDQKSEDEKSSSSRSNRSRRSSSDSTEDDTSDLTYIIKSNSTFSYFNPNKSNECDIAKSNSLPLDSTKHMSQKIITCPSDDPNKPTTHLVNIAGVTIQTNDLNHLFWVPSYLHPEVHPLEFKKLMSTEANSQSPLFGRRLSIRRTKSYAESARVITPDNISENGEPVINQIQRHKTFDTFTSLKKNSSSSTFKLPKKTFIIKEEQEEDVEETKNSILDEKTKEEEAHHLKDSNDPIKEDAVLLNTVQPPIPSQNETSVSVPKLTIDTSQFSHHEPVETQAMVSTISPTQPLSSSIPESSSEEFSSPLEDESNYHEKVDDSLSEKIFLPNASDDSVNIPLLHGSYKIDSESSPPKSGWSLWWSSFGKEERKDIETLNIKKNKKSSISSPKSPFSFFKTKSSTSLADKNINYRQGKGITKAFLLTSPLIFKPLSRETEDIVYSLSYKKLATTYRPMVQQVYINNIMQQYIRKHKDAAYKVPFKNIRPPKKRRSLPKPTVNTTVSTTTPSTQNNQKRPVSVPAVASSDNINANNESFNVRNDSKKKKKKDKKNPKRKQKLVNLDEAKLDELLEQGIEYDDINTKKPKRRTKVRPTSGDFSEKYGKPIYQNKHHSISFDQFDTVTPSLPPHNKYQRNSISFDYFNYYSTTTYSEGSEEEEDDDDDEVPLAMLRNKRSSIITI